MRRERINHSIDVIRLSPEEQRAAFADYVRKHLPPDEDVTQAVIFDWYYAERVNVDVFVRTIR